MVTTRGPKQESGGQVSGGGGAQPAPGKSTLVSQLGGGGGDGVVPHGPLDAASAWSHDGRAPGLEADPDHLAFGSEVVGDATGIVTIRNRGTAAATIEDCYAVGAGFSASIVDKAAIPPGGSARLLVEFHPSQYAGDAGQAVVMSGGGSLSIPLSGPRTNASKLAGGLEVFPADLHFEPVQLGPGGGSAPLETIGIRNRGTRPVRVGSVRAMLGDAAPFRSSFHNEVIAPGETRRASVDFAPHAAGEFHAHMIVTDLGGDQVLGAFDVTGTAAAPAARPPPAPAKPAWKAKTLDEANQMDAARRQADLAIRMWNTAANRSITATYNGLRDEWAEYLAATSGNPYLSRVAVPSESILLYMLGKFITGIGKKAWVAAGKRLGDGGGDAATDATADAAKGAAAAGGTLLELGMDLVTGVLLKTIGHVLYNWLIRDDAFAEVVREAHDEGFTQGSKAAGAAIRAKLGELAVAETAALGAQSDSANQASTAMFAASSVGEVRAIATRIAHLTDEAAAVRSARGLASELLAIWVREHAGAANAPGGDVFKGQWKAATAKLAEEDPTHFGANEIRNQPDLFVSQCQYEWTRRGLRTRPELTQALLRELAAPTDPIAGQLPAPVIAQRAQARFNEREFVWSVLDDVDEQQYRKGLPTPTLGKPDGPFDLGAKAISCQPSLAVAGGTCYVTEFHYRLSDGKYWTTKPGAEKWDGMKTDYTRDHTTSLPSDDEQRFYQHIVPTLERHGATVVAGKDKSVAQAAPRVGHADGRPEPVASFTVHLARVAPEAWTELEMPALSGVQRFGNVEATFQP